MARAGRACGVVKGDAAGGQCDPEGRARSGALWRTLLYFANSATEVALFEDWTGNTMAAADGGLRIFIDVQSSFDFKIAGLRKTGIQRVEFEIAKNLVAQNHTAVVWNRDIDGYRTISIANISGEATPPHNDEIDRLLEAPRAAIDVPAKDIMRLRQGVALSLVFPKFGSSRERFIMRLTGLFGRTAHALPVPERKAIARILKLDRRVVRAKCFITEARIAAECRSAAASTVDFQPGDILFVPAPWWATPAAMHFPTLVQRGVHIVPLIYDLYPIRSPHVVLSREIEIIFAQSLALLSHVSDLALAISEWTARDATAWFEEQNLRAPRIAVVPLTAALRPSAGLTPLPPKDFPFAPERFVLLSGSFSATKNQNWTHMLWSRLHDRLGDATWPLVYAGQRGANQEETILRVRSDARYGRTLYWVESPSDAELAWLHTYCGFNIMPSEFEGWGLPLSEALAFGKPCLSSGLGALAEAGQGIVWERDPIDGVAWLDQCARWITDPQSLAAERECVRRNYRPRSWEDVTDDILRAIRQNLPVGADADGR